MAPKTPDRQISSLDALAEGLPEDIVDAVKGLLIEAARVQGEVLNDGNRESGMHEAFMAIDMLAEDLAARVNSGLEEREREEAEAEKSRLLAEGYAMFQKVGENDQLPISWDIAEGGPGSVNMTMGEVISLAERGLVEARMARKEECSSGILNVITTDGVELMTLMDHDRRVVTFLFEAGNFPNSPDARRVICKEFRAAGAAESRVKYRSVESFSSSALTAEVNKGNISLRRGPFGDEHPRSSEVMRLSTSDRLNFLCLITDGDDQKIEIYFPKG